MELQNFKVVFIFFLMILIFSTTKHFLELKHSKKKI